MNTFLPFKDFKESAKALDPKRLGKQRSECVILVKTILGLSQGWKNHPCTLMWKNHCAALITYGLEICLEYKRRGYQDRTYDTLSSFGIGEDVFYQQRWLESERPDLLPKWLGDERLHLTHRSNLIRKDPNWYCIKLGWTDPNYYNYYWPVTKDDG